MLVAEKSYADNVQAVTDAAKKTLDSLLWNEITVGIFLSGGIDSSILLYLFLQDGFEFSIFSMGNSLDHPDIQHSSRLCRELDQTQHILIPGKEDITRAKRITGEVNKGDAGCYLLLEFASRFVDTIIATDGIDELMGGYWDHLCPDGSLNLEAFERYQTDLWPKHIEPMISSAGKIGINVKYLYLEEPFHSVVSEISLQERIAGGRKGLWRDLGRRLGVPQYIINRPKVGFCDAVYYEAK